jgi:hypothetical protein
MGTLHDEQVDSLRNDVPESATMCPFQERNVHSNFPEADLWPAMTSGLPAIRREPMLNAGITASKPTSRS